MAIEQASSDFADERAEAVFTLAQSALRTQIETVLVDALRDSFIDTLPALLSDALNSLDEALAGQTFPLDAGLGGGPIDITFNGQITSFTKDPLRSVDASVDTTLAAEVAPSKESLGTALMVPYAEGQAPFLQRSRVQIALRLGLINGLLHGLWDAGLLDLDATALLPDNLSGLISEATLQAQLPPVAYPPRAGEPYDLMIHIGQLELTLTNSLTDQRVLYGVNLRAGVNAELAEGELGITISEVPELQIWVIEVLEGGETARLSAQQLEGLFTSQLWPSLTEALGEGLGLPLPVLEISELGTYAPRPVRLRADLRPGPPRPRAPGLHPHRRSPARHSARRRRRRHGQLTSENSEGVWSFFTPPSARPHRPLQAAPRPRPGRELVLRAPPARSVGGRMHLA